MLNTLCRGSSGSFCSFFSSTFSLLCPSFWCYSSTKSRKGIVSPSPRLFSFSFSYSISFLKSAASSFGSGSLSSSLCTLTRMLRSSVGYSSSMNSWELRLIIRSSRLEFLRSSFSSRSLSTSSFRLSAFFSVSSYSLNNSSSSYYRSTFDLLSASFCAFSS